MRNYAFLSYNFYRLFHSDPSYLGHPSLSPDKCGLTTNQCSRKRVQQLQKRIKSGFWDFEKRKNVRIVSQTILITQPLILNYRKSVPVSHQHLSQQCGRKKLCSLNCVCLTPISPL